MENTSHIIQPPNDNNFNEFSDKIKQIAGKNRNDKIYVKINKNKYLNKNNSFKVN